MPSASAPGPASGPRGQTAIGAQDARSPGARPRPRPGDIAGRWSCTLRPCGTAALAFRPPGDRWSVCSGRGTTTIVGLSIGTQGSRLAHVEPPASPASPWGWPSTRASRDWARHGHTDAATQLTSVLRVEPQQTQPTPAITSRFSRRARRTVGTLLLIAVALGSAGSAVALRDALFPDTGDAATRSVWQNPGRERSPDAARAVTSVESSSTSTSVPRSATSVATTTAAAPSTTTAGSSAPTTDAEASARSQQMTVGGTGATSGTSTPAGTLPGNDDADDHDDDDDEPTAAGSSGPSESAPTTADDDSSGSGSGSDDSDNSGSGSSGSGDGGSESGDSGSHGSGSGDDDDDDSSGGSGSGSNGSGNSGSGSSGSGSDDD